MPETKNAEVIYIPAPHQSRAETARRTHELLHFCTPDHLSIYLRTEERPFFMDKELPRPSQFPTKPPAGNAPR